MCIFIMAVGAEGASYTFQPSPVDLWDLNHDNYYSWGIDWNVPAGEAITGASLFFDDIENWNNDPNDLWVHLLDFLASGTVIGSDNAAGGDQFSGQGVLLNHWQNLPSTPQDITYLFDSAELLALNNYVLDGNFGLAFDPDCHYGNNGITLTIETSNVPLPGAVWLLGSGLVSLVGIRKKLRK